MKKYLKLPKVPRSSKMYQKVRKCTKKNQKSAKKYQKETKVPKGTKNYHSVQKRTKENQK